YGQAEGARWTGARRPDSLPTGPDRGMRRSSGRLLLAVGGTAGELNPAAAATAARAHRSRASAGLASSQWALLRTSSSLPLWNVTGMTDGGTVTSPLYCRAGGPAPDRIASEGFDASAEDQSQASSGAGLLVFLPKHDPLRDLVAWISCSE